MVGLRVEPRLQFDLHPQRYLCLREPKDSVVLLGFDRDSRRWVVPLVGRTKLIGRE
jgi:hypothetical protein